MLLRLLPVAGFLLVSFPYTLEAVDIPSLNGELTSEDIVLQTKVIDGKLSKLEIRLKHLIKRNNSRSDIDKLTKYIFGTLMDIKLDLSKLVQNYSKTSNENGEQLLSHPHMDARLKKNSVHGNNVFKMCKHIIESDVCQRMQENLEQLEMTTLLRIADNLINIRTRFRIYTAIYDDMVEKHYYNIFNLNNFVNKLVYHFISNSNTPPDVIQDAKHLLKNIGKTFKDGALHEITDHIINNCTSTDIDTALWQLTKNIGAFEEFNEILEAAIKATYDSVGAFDLLERSLWGKTAQGACQTVNIVYSHIKSDGDLYNTKINFKLVQLIAQALNNSRATLEELEPCLEVEAQLNPSVREMVYARLGCLQNQLHKALLLPVNDESKNNTANRMVFVSSSDEDAEYARWNFEGDGFNTFWIRHHRTREYLYASEIPFQSGKVRGKSTEVFTLRNRQKKNRWYFELIPENGGLRILNEEQRYLYVATERVFKGDSKKHPVAIWRGQGVPSGSVWVVVPC